MKKLMMLAAMLALVAAIAVGPVLAQQDDDDRFRDRFQERFGEDFLADDFFDGFFDDDNAGVDLAVEQEAESGEFSADFSVTNTGDYASQCVPALQFGNTGNFNNAPTFLQYASEADDFEPGGIEFSFAPEMAVQCSSEVQQSSAASGGW
ncbi:MAG: hypothetical protein M3N18_00460 [Actinomycetota bacterium]|nr:hypothetical protein [Actinomycetota bacterium]